MFRQVRVIQAVAANLPACMPTLIPESIILYPPMIKSAFTTWPLQNTSRPVTYFTSSKFSDITTA